MCFRQFSSIQSVNRSGRWGDTGDDSAAIFFKSFPARSHCEQFGLSRDGCPLFHVVHPGFPLPTTRQKTLNDGFGGAAVAGFFVFFVLRRVIKPLCASARQHQSCILPCRHLTAQNTRACAILLSFSVSVQLIKTLSSELAEEKAFFR